MLEHDLGGPELVTAIDHLLTLAANLARNIASSIAQVPAATISVGACLKKAASHVAQ